MDAKIREMRPDELETVYRLYGEAFGAESLAAFKKRWRWQFVDNPATRFAPSRMWVAENDEGRIVGHIASYPMRLKVGERELLTSSSGDLLVLAETRGQGLGEKLSKAYRDSAGELATDGFGYQPVTGRIYRRLGYREVLCVPVCLRPLDLGAIFRFVMASDRVPPRLRGAFVVAAGSAACKVANLGVRLVNRMRRPSPAPDVRVERLSEVGAEIDELWRRLSPEFRLAFVRDRAFLQWRYFDDPIATHKVLAARDPDGALLGFLVYSVSPKGAMRLARLMDLFCSPTRLDVVDALLREALAGIRAESASAVICWGMHPVIRARLRKSLYIRPRGEQVPSLLYCAAGEELRAMIYETANWHVTRGDGDEGFVP